MLLVALCTGLGLVLAAPASWMLLTAQSALGRPLEAFLEPVGADQARIAVLYEFETRQGTWLAWTAIEEGVLLPRDTAAERIVAVRAAIEGPQRIRWRVHFQANDPAGTAFILTGVFSWGQKAGIVLVAFSLLLSLPLPLWSGVRRRKPQ